MTRSFCLSFLFVAGASQLGLYEILDNTALGGRHSLTESAPYLRSTRVAYCAANLLDQASLHCPRRSAFRFSLIVRVS